MSTTTAADLLARAERLSRELRSDQTPVTLQQWAAFDVTVHRLLTEMLANTESSSRSNTRRCAQ